MPFIEIVFQIVLLVVALAFIAGAYFVGGIVILGIGALILATGWIPILMCASDINMNMGEGVFGTWALWSWFLYLAATGVVLTVMTVKPDPDGLPPTFKFLALFYRYPTVEAVRGATVDAAEFVRGAAKDAGSVYGARMEERAMRREAERVNAEAARAQAAADLAEAAVKREQERARRDTYQEAQKRDE